MCKFSLYMIVLHQHGKYGDGKKLVIRGLWHKRKCATESFPRVHATHKTDRQTRTKEDLFFFFYSGKCWFIFTVHSALSIKRSLSLKPWQQVVLQSADILSRDGLCCQLFLFFLCFCNVRGSRESGSWLCRHACGQEHVGRLDVARRSRWVWQVCSTKGFRQVRQHRAGYPEPLRKL